MSGRSEGSLRDLPGISGSSKFATADRTSGYGDSVGGVGSIVRQTSWLGWRGTIVNSIFVKVRVKRGVVIIIVGVIRVGGILGNIRMRELKWDRVYRESELRREALR